VPVIRILFDDLIQKDDQAALHIYQELSNKDLVKAALRVLIAAPYRESRKTAGLNQSDHVDFGKITFYFFDELMY
jgi:hypothetical protein